MYFSEQQTSIHKTIRKRSYLPTQPGISLSFSLQKTWTEGNVRVSFISLVMWIFLKGIERIGNKAPSLPVLSLWTDWGWAMFNRDFDCFDCLCSVDHGIVGESEIKETGHLPPRTGPRVTRNEKRQVELLRHRTAKVSCEWIYIPRFKPDFTPFAPERGKD